MPDGSAVCLNGTGVAFLAERHVCEPRRSCLPLLAYHLLEPSLTPLQHYEGVHLHMSQVVPFGPQPPRSSIRALAPWCAHAFVWQST